MFVGGTDRLISARRFITFALAELCKPKSVEYIRVWIVSFIPMSGTRRHGDERACGNGHTVGKCERAQRETSRGN